MTNRVITTATSRHRIIKIHQGGNGRKRVVIPVKRGARITIIRKNYKNEH